MAPKRSPAPPPPSAAVPVEDLFTALHGHIEAFQYDRAARVADQILAVAPGDEDALRCKIVALIKSNKIDEALGAIDSSKGSSIDLRFYEAYCLYRQNKLHEALVALDTQGKSPMVLQLESQILYRLGRMDACLDSYENIQKFKIESDVKINIIAALVAAGRSAEVQGKMETLKVKASSRFELAYNTACSLIERKRYAEAEEQLLSARRIGQEVLMDEDCDDEEIEAELAPINVQLAYVRQLLGKTQEATEDYTAIINRNVADASSLAVATNNLISLRGNKDVSDSLKKLDRIMEKDSAKHFKLANGLDFKLFTRQKEALYGNRLLLLLQANRMEQAQELASALLTLFPNSITPVLLQAAILVREKKVSKAEEILGQYADKFPESSKQVLLARAQIAAAAGHFQIASESLSKVSDIQNMPATVATIVSLRDRLGDNNGAVAVLESAIQWWKNGMTEDNKLDVIMQEAASYMLNHGREKEASQLYEDLVKSHGSVDALVGLVMTAAQTDIEKAESYEKKLRPLSGLKGINVENLEKTSGAKHAEGGGVHMKVEPSEEVKKAKAKKRKRKPRYPKGFDPANPGPPPDPERWLPRRERSSYRPKRKDKRAVRGSQGAVVREKHEAATSATNPTTSTGVSTSKSGQGTTGSSKGVEPPKAAKKSKKKSRS